MKTLQKIYYVSGLFSTILIPLVFWYLGNRELQKPIPNVMDFGLPAKYNFESFRNWDYMKIIVPTNLAKKNSDYYVSEIKNLQKRNIKNTGIEFVITNNSSYADFVSIINDFAIAKHPYYAIDLDKTGNIFGIIDYNDSFKMDRYNFQVHPKDITIDYYIVEDNLNGFSKFKYQISQLPKQSFYLIFGYLFLLNMSVLSLIKRQT